MIKQFCKYLLASFLYLTLIPTSKAQITTWPILNLFFKNQFDKQGLHHGKWVVKSDVPENNTQTKTKGYYRHGYMIGTWHTYDQNKKLLKLEKGSIENKKNIIETTEYYPDGEVAKKGFAAIEFTDGKPHFYRYGPWMYYKEDASLDKTTIYDNGWPAKTIYANGQVEVSKKPENNITIFKPGEATKFDRKAGAIRGTVDKDGRMILIRYTSPTDSIITIMKNSETDVKED